MHMRRTCSTFHVVASAVVAAVSTVAFVADAFAQATAVTLSGSTYLQNFDSMTTSPTAAVPLGWGFFRSGTSSVQPAFTSGSTSTTTSANAGTVGTGAISSSSGGGAYQWVSGTLASGTDKAIGFLTASAYPGGPTGSGASSSPGNGVAILFGFSNTTGSTISDLNLAWDYEKYRSGTRAQGWSFFTSTDGSTWSANSAGDINYPSDGGNTAVNPPLTSSTSVSLAGLSIANNTSYYLRWSMTTTGSWSNGQGLGIDNFAMTATYPFVSLDLYWDGASGWSGTAPGAGGGGTWADGSGSWDSSKTATFAGTAGTVTAGTVSADRGINFGTTGYTLSGGTITLSGSPSSLNTVTTGTDTSVTATIDSSLAGSGGLTKAGAGTLVLGGVNTFTGNVPVNAGTLQVAADSALGDAANDISLAGSTLKTTASVSMGSGRDVTGSGTIDIAPGTTLTSSGSFNLTATTLANAGTLDLQGGTRTVGNLTFGSAATVNGSGTISATGLSATGVTSGSAVVNPAITFSSGDKTVDVGSGGSLVLNGDIAGTTGRIAKTGAGTLIVSGSNTTSGYRVGVSGASPTNGGTVILAAAAASGTGQLQLNYGTLQGTAPFTFANGLSIGGRTGAVAVLGGPNAMTFSGSTGFFRGTATSGELRLDVNNATILSGTVGATSGGGSATGITLGGTGSLTLNGGAAVTELITLQDSLDLIVNNTLGGGVNVANGTLLGGTGTIAGAVSILGGGILSPGTSPGTLTINNTLGFAGTSVLNFELNAADQTIGGGVNDLVTGVTNLTLDGILNVSGIGDFTTIAAPVSWRLFNYSGTLTDSGVTLGSLPTLAAGQSYVLDTATTGEVNLSVIPEPTSLLSAGALALAAMTAYMRRNRRG
jgi:autotransporter-associated beta strand protein